MTKKNNHKIIVFFDGYCGLCSHAVDFLIARDKNKKFKYSPLQGDYIKTLGIKLDTLDLKTLYVYDGSRCLEKTHAWRKLAIELGGIWKFLGLLSYIIPTFILNFFYDIIAKYRYNIFGKRETCRLPSSEERELFLL